MATYGGDKMWFPVDKKRPPSVTSEDVEIPVVVTLAPFHPIPRLSFGRVIVGTTKTVQLVISNPNNNERRVIVDKFPKGDAGFDWHPHYVRVSSHQEEVIEVSWTPLKEGNRRETIGFFVENNFCLKVYLVGEAVAKRKKLRRYNAPISVLYPIENVQIQRCPVIVPQLTRTDNSTNSAAATFTVAPPPINFCDGLQPSMIDESSNLAGPSRALGMLFDGEFFQTPERRQTFLVPPKINRENYDLFQTVCNGSDLPPCNVPLTPERRNTYVKSPRKEIISTGSSSSISEDSLEEKRPTLASLRAANGVANAAASVVRSPMFKKPGPPLPLCSTQLKDKPLPELKCDATPVFFRKQLFPRPNLAGSGQMQSHSFSVGASTSAKINRPADGQQTAFKGRQLTELTMEQLVDDSSNAWWLQKPDVLNDYLSYVLRVRGNFGYDEPKKADRWLQSGYETFVKIREAVIVIQTTVRMFVQRRKFLRLKLVTLKIQRWYRSSTKTRHERKKFLEIRASVIAVQAVVRGFLQVQRFRRLRSATVTIQTYICATIIFRVLLICNAAAITLLAIVKGFLQARLWFAAITIQRRWKACIAGIRQRKTFLEMKCAALVLQTAWRGFRERRQFVQKRMAVIRIQSAVRTWIARRTLEKQRRLHRAAVVIQTAWRAFAARKMIKAAVVIQRWFRSVQLVAEDRRSFLHQREACIRIQAFVRAYIKEKNERQAAAAAAAVKIQRWFRSLRARDFFVRLRSSSIKIQAIFRGHIYRRELKRRRIAVEQAWGRPLEAAAAHQSSTDENARESAAIVIQRVWRGYVVRKLVKPQEMSLVRDNLARVNAAAIPEQQLGNRTRNSLKYLLKCKLLSSIMREVENLEVTTSMSRMSCEQLARSKALDTLIHIIKNRNRSLPNIDIVYHAIGVLINVAKCDSTVDALFETENLLDTILHLASVYHEKAKGLFTRCVSLLWIFGQDVERAQSMRKHIGLTERLRAIHGNVHRKHDLAMQCLMRRHRMNDQKVTPFHNLSALQVQRPPRTDCRKMPDWVIGRQAGGHRRIAEFDDPIAAIDQLMRLIKSEAKP